MQEVKQYNLRQIFEPNHAENGKPVVTNCKPQTEYFKTFFVKKYLGTTYPKFLILKVYTTYFDFR